MWLRGTLGGSALAAALLASGLPAHAQDLAPTAKSAAQVERKRIEAREQWFLRGRSAAGHSSAEFLQGAYRQKLTLRHRRGAILAAHAATLVPPAGWTSLGPAPLCSDASAPDQQHCAGGQQNYNWVSGRATAVAIDPADPSGNTVYAGGAQGGLWKSSNAACSDPSTVTWNAPAGSGTGCAGAAQSSPFSLIDGQQTLAVGSIAVQPGNPPGQAVVLVGTGETNSSTDSYYGLGILRSADGGDSWTLISQDAAQAHSFSGIGFSQIAFSTNNPKLVVAATAGASQGLLDGRENPAQSNLGLYYSSDSGQTWSYATISDGSTTIGPASVTAVVYNAAYNGGTGAFFAAVRFHGFYVSTDGANWSRLPDQPGFFLSALACPSSPALPSCPIYRGAIAVVPNRSGGQAMGEMYAWYVDANDSDGGIWETVDGGSTWLQINETGITDCGDLLGGCGTENGAYNLTLAAVPNTASGTDLYAGAVNLYKCTISTQYPNCIPNGTPTPPPDATFENLTHVYGCDPLGAIARVHPSQHAMDFLPVNSGLQVVMYFANDGGIYRALDGYSGLTSGNCATPNQFDSLNQTLGSMTPFVAMAQHPTDANTLLGGTQSNGSPATGNGLSSPQWANVNSGDGGYSEINPGNPDEWFTENTGVSIQHCTLGIDCGAADFSLIVSSATLGGDGGPLYTPYMLDPLNSGELVVGTCRVWRGATSGAGFSSLSQNFDTLSNTSCTGSEVNTVRSLAAGGPAVNGFSGVIYAGTDGTGPLAQTPAGGHVWVMKTAADGTVSWSDVTGAVNPENFPVSGIALDSSDPSGSTAYITIMGFGVSHVWQTTNAGQTWTDFSGTSGNSPLPDAPANAVAVDNGTVYVATDVGVFASSTSDEQWVETGSGSAGLLPDVPVMGLRIFNDGTTKLLRAATYGRGVWQFALTSAPDFQIAILNPIQTGFAGQAATFSGTLVIFDGYSDTVTLSCVGTNSPNICAPTLNPDGSFTLAAGGAVGDYSFGLQATGADGLTRSSALTLHVVDFALSLPAPAAVTLQPGTSSGPINLQVSFLGSFPSNGMVDLSCAAGAGVTCNFFPSASVSIAQGNPASVTLTVAAGSSAAGGSSTVEIAASSSVGDPKMVSQPLGLTVIRPDYALALSSGVLILPARQAATSIAATATAANGYSSAVALSCTATVVSGTGAAPSCTIPATVTPSAAGTAFQIILGSGTAGSYSFSIQGVGSDAAAITSTAPLAVTLYDFTVSVNPGTQTVTGGQSATYTLSLAPTGLPTFQQAVSLSCAQLPSPGACQFSANPLSGGAQTVTLTVSTAASMAWSGRMRPQARGWLYAMLLPGALLGLAFVGCGQDRRGQGVICLGLVALVLMVILQAACGGGLSGGSSALPAPAGSGSSNAYVFTVNVTEGELQPAQPLQLTLVVQ